MSEPLHKRMFRKWGKDRCRQAYRFRGLGMDYPYIRDKLWPDGDGGTSRSVKAMVGAWGEYLDTIISAAPVELRSVVIANSEKS